ncbi:MAG TPA: S41 family peptidase [Bacteroidales bacterium]|nr:S41 family peptidase [Bacteroidales bacterium]
MNKVSILLLAFILSFLSSCKKEDPEPVANPTADEIARDDFYNIMKSYYLWDKLMPVVVKEDYSGPRELLEAMRYKELDRWSYIQDYDDYLNQSQAIFVGHGIRLGLDENNKMRIAQIYNNSPMYALGVRRGWIIKKLNDTDLAPIFIAGDGEAYYNLIGPSTAGVTNKFLFETPEGKDSTITTTKTTFTLNTVLDYDTLHLKTGITGHLVFEQFIEPSNAELEKAFAFFKGNNINNIIIDLRYNGGGDLTVLQNLAAYIGGSSKFGKPFLTLTHNEQQTSRNKTYNFGTVASPVSVGKMIVITTRSTGSASEDLINGLKPFMEIKTVGDTTNGKPVGMYGFKHSTLYMFWPISFALLNTAGEGDFYDGFFPEKYVPDDITHDWGDRDESCLKEAIYMMENGTVSAKSTYNYRRSVQLSESPERQNNAYFIENR